MKFAHRGEKPVPQYKIELDKIVLNNKKLLPDRIASDVKIAL